MVVLLAVGRDLVDGTRTDVNYVDWWSILPKKLVAVATSLEGSKNNFRLFIYSLANSVKICSVDVQISDPAESSKIKYKTAAFYTQAEVTSHNL